MSKRALEHEIAIPAAPISVWVSSFTLGLLGLAMPLVMLQIFDRVIPTQATQTLLVLFIGMVGVVTVEAVLKILRARILALQAANFEAQLQDRLTSILFDPRQNSQKITAHRAQFGLQAISKLRDYLSSPGRLVIIDLPFAGIAIMVIYVLAGNLALVPVIGFIFLLALTLVVRRVQRHALESRSEVDKRRIDAFHAALKHNAVVKLNQLEIGLHSRFKADQARFARTNQTVMLSSNLIQGLVQGLGLAFSPAIVLVGGFYVIAGDIGMAELAACTMLNGRATQPVMAALLQWASGESFQQTLREVASITEHELEMKPIKDLPRSAMSLEFADVTLRAATAGRAILRDFSLQLEDGFSVLLTRSSGHAQIVFEALLGERKPNTGRVLLNGEPTHDMVGFRGANMLVCVDDEFVPFEGTIIQNIALSEDGDTIERAYRSAELLGLEDDINQLPNGYDTDLQKSGFMEGSRGFLQRLNIARALACDPGILLFNDAMNAMDNHRQIRTAAVLQYIAQDCLILAYDSSETLDSFADRTIDLAKTNSAHTSKSPGAHKRKCDVKRTQPSTDDYRKALVEP
ncbi:MAG: ABC transporter transmembrane domain-containing protein [Pseudomonadota bacterium]